MPQALADRDDPHMPIRRDNRCQSNYYSTGELSEFMECLLINFMRVAVSVDSD